MLTNTALILHVLVGLVGVGAAYAVTLGFFKRALDVRFMLWASAVAAVSFVLSYLFGGYYFDVAYKTGVEEAIRTGPRPWADLFFMEAKGRIFLFLPMLAIAVFAVLFAYRDELNEDAALKRELARVAFAVFVIGVFVAAAGLVVSGAAAL